jgi:methylmalonyl-CoA mutase
VDAGGNVFAELISTVEHCTLGQITGRLQEVVGIYRPTI